MSCVLTTQKKKFPIFLILLANWAFTFFPFLRSYVNLSTRNNLMGNLKQQSLSVFQFCEGRTSGVKCPPFVPFLGFLLLLLITKPGEQNFFTLFYVHQWMWPRGWNTGSAIYGVWDLCNNTNTEFLPSKKNYFSVRICINSLCSFLWLFLHWVWHGCVFSRRQKEKGLSL